MTSQAIWTRSEGWIGPTVPSSPTYLRPSLSQGSPRNHSCHKFFQQLRAPAENRQVIQRGHNFSMCMTEVFMCVRRKRIRGREGWLPKEIITSSIITVLIYKRGQFIFVELVIMATQLRAILMPYSQIHLSMFQSRIIEENPMKLKKVKMEE